MSIMGHVVILHFPNWPTNAYIIIIVSLLFLLVMKIPENKKYKKYKKKYNTQQNMKWLRLGKGLGLVKMLS